MLCITDIFDIYLFNLFPIFECQCLYSFRQAVFTDSKSVLFSNDVTHNESIRMS